MRFVSTPEVLERFVTVEREIEQIENSIQSNEAANAAGATETDGMFCLNLFFSCYEDLLMLWWILVYEVHQLY